jgi:hypothetical protein
MTGKHRRLCCSDCCATRQGEADSRQDRPQAPYEAPPRPTPGIGLHLDSGRRSPPRPTPGLGLHLDLGRRTPPRPTPELGLNLDSGRRSPPRPTPGLGLNLDLGRRSPPRPTPGLGLNLDPGEAPASLDLGLGPTTSQGGASLPYL